MWYGVALTLGIEFCLFIAYIFIRAKKELKEEEQRIYFYEEDLYI
jgi:hypothetical protein